ncbi:hypothetical protein PpBr36_01425 [Pyricularia pennisetigena]|uniref:hypothetical protein n=1 Tax=Pyricularia pennisetigena TaxID=1578925 RepID=UPI00114FA700|nr:hypothetical protein PpBr36_01425 [Pyricularia pennisetigena]TLS28449.1 hypothetical protein PpBr36_01425 [Pyricularia pennisetigena]
MSANAEAVTRNLLSRAHSPPSVDRIYAEKIQHRPLRLRANSPPPAATAREARRAARQQKTKDRAKQLRPKPLSARERRRLGLYRVPAEGGARRYETFVPLHALWLDYIREVLGSGDLRSGGVNAAAKLTSADFHGAEVEVVRSSCPGRVGIKGIVVKDSRFVFEIITRKNVLKMVPKEGTIFRVEVPLAAGRDDVGGENAGGSKKPNQDTMDLPADKDKRKFVFDIHGEQFQLRSIDRANKKFKAHFLPNL